MTKQEQIRQALDRFTSKRGPIQTLLATVKSVDNEELTCVVDEDGLDIFDVRLRPVLNGEESITLFPKVGSWVLITRIEEDFEWMVIACDQVDKVRIVADSMQFEMKDGKFLVKSGDESLGKCIDDLITQIQAIYAPKNSAEIANIKQRFKQLLSAD